MRLVTVMMNADQINSFNARVKKIQDPRNTHYVDAETGMKIPKHVSRKEILRAKGDVSPGLIGLMIALILGAVCLMGARLARFTVLDMPEINDTTLMIELALAAIIAFTVGGVIRQGHLRHMLAQVAGAAVMAVAMHNLVWMFPEEFEMVYPQSYVDQVRSQTRPNSLFVRGQTYTI